MSFYDREWYKESIKNSESGKGNNSVENNKSQTFWDTAWAEIEPSHSKKQINSASSIKDKKNKDSTKSGLNEYVRIQGGCTKCGDAIPLIVKKKNLSHFSYICPRCKQKMTVISARNLSKVDKIVTVGLYVFGILVIGAVLIAWLSLYLNGILY